MESPAIETNGLGKSYGAQAALADLDLVVPRGTVFGYLGPNGAGKSTTIRLLMGLIFPSSGSANVLGVPLGRGHDATVLRRRIGYLPGDFIGYRDMTVGEYLGYISHLCGGVPPADRTELMERFEIGPDRRLSTLSHGNRQKVGLIQAMMHRPDLLVFDEPTSGLDPLMQREFLEIVGEIRDDGRTVFLSSHVLTEVEAVADRVAIIRSGRLVMSTDVATLQERTRRRVELTFAPDTTPPTEVLSGLASVRSCRTDGQVVDLTVEGSMAELLRVAAPLGIERVVSADVDLTETFLREYDGNEV